MFHLITGILSFWPSPVIYISTGISSLILESVFDLQFTTKAVHVSDISMAEFHLKSVGYLFENVIVLS